MLKFILFFLIYIPFIYSQVYSVKDIELCNQKFRFAVEKKLSEKPVGDVIVEIGRSFIGTDYEANTLEKGDEETLVINLTGLDCTTFLENSLVFARLIKKNQTTFEDYKRELQKVRYRNSIINKYPSRLNYFSDWIYDNEKKEIVKDITKEIGGKSVKFKVNFMSSNPDSYIKLKNNPEFIPVIKDQEDEINKREYYFIPKEKIASIESKIQNGDLIAITTNIKGLDISHTGIAFKQDGRIHFLHAPAVGSKVQVTKEPLSDYLSKIKKHTGIIVLRPLEPKKEFNIEEGDLLFQDLDCGPLCEAIEKVTPGFNDADFSHIGLAVKDLTGQIVILESISDNVKTTPLNEFLNRSFDSDGNPKVIVGRIKPEFQEIIPKFVKTAKSYLDKPYDEVYVMDNDSYYCSELIYLAAKKANNENPFFDLQPMTFKNPGSEDFNPAWIEYYKNMNVEIPEGEPGINPGLISISPKIDIIYIFGYPAGFKKENYPPL